MQSKPYTFCLQFFTLPTPLPTNVNVSAMGSNLNFNRKGLGWMDMTNSIQIQQIVEFLQFQEDYFMNRSHSDCFRRLGAQPAKKHASRSATKLEFRTVLKYRNTHDICQKGALSYSIKDQKHKQQMQGEDSKAYETAGQQEMREFIKMMKSNAPCSQISNAVPPTPERTKRAAPCQSARSVKSQSFRSEKPAEPLASQTCTPRIDNEDTLDSMERRIEELIRAKLSKSSRSNISSRFEEDQVDEELKVLVDRVRRFANTKRSNDTVGTDIERINKKIGIIEKAIASSSTENELLKKMYSATKKVRKSYATLFQKSAQSRSSSAQQQFAMPSPPPLYYETTNLSHFVKPVSSSYLSQSVKKASYILNRQPLPRSLYQREFLYYGIVPTYSNNSRISVDPALKVSKASKFEEDKSPTCDRKLTVYQTEFKEKETRIMDSKELDCRVDKFRNVNISFMPKRRGAGEKSIFNMPHGIELKKARNKTKQIALTQKHPQGRPQGKKSPQSAHPLGSHCQSNADKQNVLSGSFIGKTEHQAQFKAPYGSNIKRSSESTWKFMAKEKNLNSLKYAYKCQFAV